MCRFFSAISKGKEVLFFKVEEVAKIMSEGNPKSYEWNSHTSIADFYGIKGAEEDSWNKWEYDVDKKELVLDSGSGEDRAAVEVAIVEYLKDKNIDFIRNMYNLNSGNLNSGNWNSGNWNSGNRNSGNRNSGNWNSGNLNSGNLNSGNLNSGDRNSGDLNSGNWNSGNLNSGNGYFNNFCTETKYYLFDKPCTKKDRDKLFDIDWYWFDLVLWISDSDMTDKEKKDHPEHKTIGGYVKTVGYKEAWKKCPKEVISKIKKLKNFNKKKFFEITGLHV